MKKHLSSKRDFLDEQSLSILADFDLKSNRSSTSKSLNIDLINKKVYLDGVGSRSIDAIVDNLSAEHLKGFTDTVFSISNSGTVADSTLVTAYIKNINLFFKTTKTKIIEIQSVSSFHEYCRKNLMPPYIFASIKTFFIKWNQYGYSGVNEDVVDFLIETRPPVKNKPSGSKVRSDNLEEGWYSEQEYTDLVKTIWFDYETDRVSLQNTLILLLSAQYGRRPIQVAHLKILDLKESGETNGVRGRRIEFPGVKDKGTGNKFRRSKQEVHPINDELWHLCRLQADESISKWKSFFGQEFGKIESSFLPLFYPEREHVGRKYVELAHKNSSEEANICASQYLHRAPVAVSKIIRRHAYYDKETGEEKCMGTPVVSQRTNKTLVETAYRFRYTRARQLARMGVPKATLQFWLGHESSTSIDAYYDDPAESAKHIDKTLNPLLSPLAQAFQGLLIDSEKQATRANDPSSRIELDGKEELGLGSCGEYGFCAASVPIPCYRCTKFQPWVYGPHAEVLDRLIERQALENSIALPNQGRNLLVPLQLEREIKDVRAVIQLCEKRKEELRKIDE